MDTLLMFAMIVAYVCATIGGFAYALCVYQMYRYLGSLQAMQDTRLGITRSWPQAKWYLFAFIAGMSWLAAVEVT